MKKRTAAVVAGAVATGVLLSGCTSPVGGPTPQGAAPPLDLPVLTSTAFVRNFNPFAPGNPINTTGTVYEPLYIVNQSQQGEEIPWLADGYEWSEDLTQLTFTMREGVQWSDGEALGAEDVVFTFELGRENAALDLSGFWGALGGTDVEQVGENQVVFTFGSADVTQFPQLVNNSWVLPEHVWAAQDDPVNWLNPNPVGSGPFTQVQSFSPQSYTLAANPNYWQDEQVVVPALNYVQYANQDGITNALKADRLDWATIVVPDIETTYVSEDPEHNKYNYAANTAALMLCVNSTVAPFDDPAFRKAISKSINRQAIQNNAVYGYAIPSTASGIGGQYPEIDIAAGDSPLNEVVTHDIEAAKADLAAAGYQVVDGSLRDRAGQPISVSLPVTSSWFDWVSTAQIIADGLGELGIEATVDPKPEFSGWIEALQTGDFTLSECGGGLFNSPSKYYESMFASELMVPVGELATQNSFGRWSSPEMDAIFDELRSTTDEARQDELYAELQEIFIRELPNIPLNSAPFWQVFTTHDYTGWPSEEDSYSIGLFGDYNQLLTYPRLVPAAQG